MVISCGAVSVQRFNKMVDTKNVPASPPPKRPYEEMSNGALILLLLRDCKTWEELCQRFLYVDPLDIEYNTTSLGLYQKLAELRQLDLIEFDEKVENGRKRIGEIKATDLWSKIRVAFGGMSLREVAKLSRHSRGMAVTPVFGRPADLEEKADVFVLMPYKAEMANVYTQHIKKLEKKLKVKIRRADDSFAPKPFMTKVWEGICAARMVIADCTEKNPNVFYEIGIAHMVGKPVVLITRSKNDIPADLQHIEYIEYSYDPEGTKDLLKKLSDIIKKELQTTS
jgi:hypothetical protein